VLGAGVVLRVREYLFARSLWLDEAALALNILERSSGGLFGSLDYQQAAAPGFLVLAKGLTQILGPNELALRLLPFLAGLSALGLVYLAGRRLIGAHGALVAAGLFALMRPAIYYSAEVKQYSTDVAATLLLVWLAARTLDEPIWGRRYVALAIVGAIAMWFSHAAMMVNAGLGIVLGLRALHMQSMATVRWLAVPAVVWIASFVPLYVISISDLVGNDYFQGYWADGYPPLIPMSTADLSWYYTTLFALLEVATGAHGGALALVGLLLGTVKLLADTRARWRWGLLAAPAIVCWLLAGLQLYPFSERLVLFLLPSVLLLVALGVVETWNRSRLAGTLAASALFMTPLLFATADFARPRGREELRPVLERLDQAMAPGDRLLLYNGAETAFEYYRRHGDVGPFPERDLVAMSRDDWDGYKRRLEELSQPGRAWIVFSHVYASSGANEEALFLLFLDDLGTRLRQIEGEGASAYLYQFSN